MTDITQEVIDRIVPALGPVSENFVAEWALWQDRKRIREELAALIEEPAVFASRHNDDTGECEPVEIDTPMLAKLRERMADRSSPTNLENAERAEMGTFSPPFSYVPIPLDEEGQGPADDVDAVSVAHDVWDANCVTVATCSNEEAARSVAALMNAGLEARIRSCLLDKPEAGEAEPVEERPEPWGIVRKGSDGDVAIFSTKFNSVKARFTAGNALKSGQMLYVHPHSPADTDAAQCARRKAFEEAAELIEANIVKDSSAGKFLAPRQEGNRDGLHYAAAIRQLTQEPTHE